MEFVVAGITASPMLPFGWAFFTGLIFAIVGAAGGILAVVGHVPVLGLADANMIKPMSQIVTLITAVCAMPLYYRQ